MPKEFNDYIDDVLRTGEKKEIPAEAVARFNARVSAKCNPIIEEHRRQQRIGWAKSRHIIVD